MLLTDLRGRCIDCYFKRHDVFPGNELKTGPARCRKSVRDKKRMRADEDSNQRMI